MRISFWARVGFSAMTLSGLATLASAADNQPDNGRVWIGTWATAAQPSIPKSLQTYHNQTLRLIVHTSGGGHKVRIKLSNAYGDKPLVIGAAHIARRASAADIDPASDRTLKFQSHASVTIPAGAMAVSDPVELDVPALSDLAISLFLPESTEAKTVHSLAKQTSYVSPETGDATAMAKFSVDKAIRTWPFLTGVDVEAAPGALSIVALGSCLTYGDSTTTDTRVRG